MKITKNQLITAAIHDLSGFGRCSLAVIIPIISAMGIQCVPVPTALLSTHTGGFTDFVFRDETGFLSPACEHYKKLGIKFSAIYSGFLASGEQVGSCLEYFDAFPEAMRVVDPVLGEDGKPYQTVTPELIGRMKELVCRADIITPNITEAAMLLDEPYPETLTEGEARDWLERLCRMSGSAVMTGVTLDTGKHANLCLDKNGSYDRVCWEPLPASYPGTGDIFASVLTGKLLLGGALSEAARCASDFSYRAVENSLDSGQPTRSGVQFEPLLHTLAPELSE